MTKTREEKISNGLKGNKNRRLSNKGNAVARNYRLTPEALAAVEWSVAEGEYSDKSQFVREAVIHYAEWLKKKRA